MIIVRIMRHTVKKNMMSFKTHVKFSGAKTSESE